MCLQAQRTRRDQSPRRVTAGSRSSSAVDASAEWTSIRVRQTGHPAAASSRCAGRAGTGQPRWSHPSRARGRVAGRRTGAEGPHPLQEVVGSGGAGQVETGDSSRWRSREHGRRRTRASPRRRRDPAPGRAPGSACASKPPVTHPRDPVVLDQDRGRSGVVRRVDEAVAEQGPHGAARRLREITSRCTWLVLRRSATSWPHAETVRPGSLGSQPAPPST